MMEQAIQQQIDEIRKRMKCSKEFQCAKSGFKKLCRAKDVGLKLHLLCLEETSALCDFSLELEEKYYCGCPLRVYLTKSLNKDETSKAEM
jgi:hypothetical protein